ncbi:MAG: DUF4159 domain-containing protein [Phycisphaerae bacterium]
MTRPLLCIASVIFSSTAIAEDAISTDEIQLAIDRAVSFLETIQRPEGRWLSVRAEMTHPNAASALGAYTLHQAGKPASYWRIARVARAFKDRSKTTTAFARAITLSLFLSLAPKEYSKEIKNDIKYLVWQQATTGGWGEPWLTPEEEMEGGEAAKEKARRKGNVPRFVEPVGSFMAIRAMREAIRHGEPVNFKVWNREQAIGTERANEDGGWPYIILEDSEVEQPSDAVATAARLATLYYLYDVRYLDAPLRFNGRFMAKCGKPSPKTKELLKAIDDGWRWIEKHFDPVTMETHRPQMSLYPELDSHQFYMFALTEAALAAGRTHIAGQPWPESIANSLIRRQEPDGSWRTVDATCFGILALLNCKRPVMMSRIEAEPERYWHRTPRDAMNLSQRVSQITGEPYGWQRVDVAQNADELFRAPIAYLTGHAMPTLRKEDWKSLKEYVDRGGTLLGVPCCSSVEFSDGFKETIKQQFPRFSEEPIDRSHEMFLLNSPPTEIPNLIGWGDALRTSVFLLDVPAGCAWQQNMFDGRDLGPWSETFDALHAYTTYGRANEKRLPGFIASPKTLQPDCDTGGALSIMRLRHDGDWWIKPAALPRLAEEMSPKLCLEHKGACKGKDLRRHKPDVAWLTGTTFSPLTAAALAEFRAYLRSGGTLLASPAGGPDGFDQPFRTFVTSLFGESAWTRVPAEDPLLTGSFSESRGTPIEPLAFRPRVGNDTGIADTDVEVWGIKQGDRWIVLYVPFDLTGVIVDDACPSCIGYTRDGSLAILRNILGYIAESN